MVRGFFVHAENIPMLDGCTMLLPFKRVNSDASRHQDGALIIGDGLGSRLSYEKGRCADWGHGQLCRQAAARQIACGITPRFRYSESARIPTDENSHAVERDVLAPVACSTGPASDVGALRFHRAIGGLPRLRRRCRKCAPLTLLPAASSSSMLGALAFLGCALSAGCVSRRQSNWRRVA